jgi:hypothetical protein
MHSVYNQSLNSAVRENNAMSALEPDFERIEP